MSSELSSSSPYSEIKGPAEWSCKLGPIPEKFFEEADKLLLFAVKTIYSKLMGKGPDFCASGWDGMRKIHGLRVDPREYARLKTMAGTFAIRYPDETKNIRSVFDKAWDSGEFQKAEKELKEFKSKSGS